MKGLSCIFKVSQPNQQQSQRPESQKSSKHQRKQIIESLYTSPVYSLFSQQPPLTDDFCRNTVNVLYGCWQLVPREASRHRPEPGLAAAPQRRRTMSHGSCLGEDYKQATLGASSTTQMGSNTDGFHSWVERGQEWRWAVWSRCTNGQWDSSS